MLSASWNKFSMTRVVIVIFMIGSDYLIDMASLHVCLWKQAFCDTVKYLWKGHVKNWSQIKR